MWYGLGPDEAPTASALNIQGVQIQKPGSVDWVVAARNGKRGDLSM